MGTVERGLQAEAKGLFFTRNSETKGHKQCCFRVQARKCSSEGTQIPLVTSRPGADRVLITYMGSGWDFPS